jgi:alpha-tubulin suppressor-like RCC1 family protein
LTTGGGVKCWGDNHYGQLGDGTTTERLAAVAVTGLGSGVLSVTTGWYHSCALTSGGGVKCWGANFTGQLGNGSGAQSPLPLDVTGLASGVLAISAGQDHTCALTAAGGVKCWGHNGNGQLGDNTTTNRTTPVDVNGFASGAMAVAAGGAHTCALTTGGGAKCWGDNAYGQLGDGTTDDALTPVDVTGLGSGMASIAAGRRHSCARTGGGGVKCWGYNLNGQLGDGSTTSPRTTPVGVNGLETGVNDVAAGLSHTCALTTGGGMKCWGNNYDGQLGDGTTAQRNAPVDVSGLATGVATMATGANHSCAVLVGGDVRCWGWNDYGQVGDGTVTRRWTAVDVTGLASGVAAIATGGFHSCALTSGGGVKCWGSNEFGQLGDGTTTQRLTPVNVSGLGSGVVAITAGGYHSCALTSGGGMKCWGTNSSGQLGDDTMTTHVTPNDVPTLTSGVDEIAAGYRTTCVVTTGGGAKCWGNNANGQVGDGSTTIRLSPVDVSGLTSGVSQVAASQYHTCVRTSGGGAKCWGYNGNGQLGDGTTTQHPTPVDVSGLTSGVAAIATGLQHSCARTSGGGAKCWGTNSVGQLGDGTTTTRATAVDVTGLTSGVAALTAGSAGYHTCALTTGGGAKCWGSNGAGQLGDGTVIQRYTAVDVAGLASGVDELAAGQNHTCALTSAGGVKCWGDNRNGQVGDGTSGVRTVPVAVLTAEALPPVLLGASSRKAHGAAGTFDLPLNLTSTNPTTEPRSGGAGGNHTIVFTFDKPVTAGNASVTAGPGTAGAATFVGSEMRVPLSGVTNQQYVTVAVSDVVAADGGTGGTGSVRIGFLLGDVSQNRVVTVSDLAQVNAQIAQVVTSSNYLKDVNASGTLTVADKGIANTQITKALPDPSLPAP